MASTQDIKNRQQSRRLEKRRKQRRTVTVGVLLLIIIFVLIAGVKRIFSNSSNNDEISAENLVLLPEQAQKTTDILASTPNNDGVKVCYLTFDDGPTISVTPELLDILRRYNVKATFFMTGALLEENPQIAYRVYKEGHTLANHSYRHNYSYLYESEENFIREISDTHEKICEITGKKNYPKIFRFPGGGFNSGSYGEVKQEYKKTLERLGYRFADWNSLSGDAESRSPVASALVNRVKTSSAGKEDLVVLMHDSATKKVNIEALPQILDYLIGEGYTFSTLDKAP